MRSEMREVSNRVAAGRIRDRRQSEIYARSTRSRFPSLRVENNNDKKEETKSRKIYKFAKE